MSAFFPFFVVLRAPSFPSKADAEKWGKAEYPHHYIRIESALDDAEWQRERAIRKRNREQLGGKPLSDEDDAA